MNVKPLLKAIDAYIAKADEELEETFQEEGRADPKDSVKAVSAIEAGIAAALVKETDYFIAEIKKFNKPSNASNALKNVLNALEIIKDNDVYCDTIQTTMEKQLNKIVPQFTDTYVKAVDSGLTGNRLSKRTTSFIRQWSGALARDMKLTSHTQLEKILVDAMENNSDIATVTRTIQESGIRNEYYRARRTAITEVMRAHNVAKQEARMQNPCVSYKRWRHTGAHKNEPRDNHVAMDNKTVLKNEPFELQGAKGDWFFPMYPVDPVLPPEESINCHCICEDIVDENILGLSLDERKALQQQAIDEMDADWEAEFDAQNRAEAGIE